MLLFGIDFISNSFYVLVFEDEMAAGVILQRVTYEASGSGVQDTEQDARAQAAAAAAAAVAQVNNNKCVACKHISRRCERPCRD